MLTSNPALRANQGFASLGNIPRPLRQINAETGLDFRHTIAYNARKTITIPLHSLARCGKTLANPPMEARMTVTVGHDSAKTKQTLSAGGLTVSYYSIPAAEAAGLGEFSKLPAALKVVLENMLRFEDAKTVSVDDIKAFSDWGKNQGKNPREIAYRPARVLMQDFTGVPAVVALAAMRAGMTGLGGDAQRIFAAGDESKGRSEAVIANGATQSRGSVKPLWIAASLRSSQ